MNLKILAQNFCRIVPASILLVNMSVLAQTPEELMKAQAGGIKLVSVGFEEASLPGTPQKWIKVICRFTTEKKWTDTLSLNFEAVADDPEGSAKRLLTGGVTYMNIAQGNNTAILYLTPSTIARFGRPKSVSVSAFRGDMPIGRVELAGSDKFSPEEAATFLRFDGAMLNVRFTPWLIADFGKTPDLAPGP